MIAGGIRTGFGSTWSEPILQSYPYRRSIRDDLLSVEILNLFPKKFRPFLGRKMAGIIGSAIES